MKTYDFTKLLNALKVEFQNYVSEIAKKDGATTFLGLGVRYNILDASNLSCDLGLSDENTEDYQDILTYNHNWEITQFDSTELEELFEEYDDFNSETCEKTETTKYHEWCKENQKSFQKQILNMLNNIDYSQLNIHNKFYCWAEDYDGSFLACNEETIDIEIRTKLFNC